MAFTLFLNFFYLMIGKASESMDCTIGSTVSLFFWSSKSTAELSMAKPASTKKVKLSKNVIIISQDIIRNKKRGKNVSLAVSLLVIFCSGLVIQRAPRSIPTMEIMEETILNQLRSTWMPRPFWNTVVWDPVEKP